MLISHGRSAEIDVLKGNNKPAKNPTITGFTRFSSLKQWICRRRPVPETRQPH
jgi:hypothetical protein